MRRFPVFLWAISVLAGCQSLPAVNTVKPEITGAIQAWVAAFNSCDLGKVATLYDQDAVLWGTVAPAIITTPAGIRQYFERVCSAKMPTKVALGEQNVRTYGDTAVNAGTYTFTAFPEGQPRAFQARYSFTYRKRDGQWLIVEHHSSMTPAAPR